MAKEIRVNLQVSVKKGNFRDTFNPGAIQIDMSGVGGGNPGIVTISHTAEQDIAFGSVTPGIVCIQNLDTVNFIKYGPKSAGLMVELGRVLPGAVAFFRLSPGVTLRMIADTLDVPAEIKGYAA